MTDMNKEREAIIRAAVAAMPHTNPMVADDLLGGFTMHTEADDIVAIFQAGRASLAASAGSEPVASYAIRMLVAAGHITQAKADESLRLAAEFTNPSPPEGAGWRPASEAPQGQLMLFCDMNASELRASFFVDWMVDGTFCGNRHHKATHCRPLPPAPPASEAKGA